MKHPADSSVLEKIYAKIGEVATLHNWIELEVEELCLVITPEYLRAWHEDILENTMFLPKMKLARSFFAKHALLDQKTKQAFEKFFGSVTLLNTERNKLVHARLILEIDPLSNPDDPEYLATFQSKKKILDSSITSLVDLIESYHRVLDELFEAKYAAEAFVAANRGKFT